MIIRRSLRHAAATTLALLALSCTRGEPVLPAARTAPAPLAATAAATPPGLPTPTAEAQVTPAATPTTIATPAVAVAPAPAAPPAPAPAVAVPAQPAATRAARVVDRGTSGRRSVALTFDAGADPGYTALILDVLRTEHVRASFGITAQWADANPDLLRDMARDGHLLINHTRDHASFTGLSTGTAPMVRSERWRELDDCAASISRIAGVEVKPYFRPPYGDYDASVAADAGAHGYGTVVMWTVDSRGWMGLAAPAIVDRVLQLATPGAIYVFHVGSQSQDGVALRSIISGLRASGYAFESVSELLSP